MIMKPPHKTYQNVMNVCTKVKNTFNEREQKYWLEGSSSTDGDSTIEESVAIISQTLFTWAIGTKKTSDFTSTK